MATIFYQVISDSYVEHGAYFYGTKAEAMAAAKEIAKEGGYAAVYRVGLPDFKKATIIRLANNEQWSSPYDELWSNYEPLHTKE